MVGACAYRSFAVGPADFGWSFISQWAIRVTATTMRRLIAVILTVVVLVTTTRARAQDAQAAQEGTQSARDAQRSRDRTSCDERLQPLEKAVESDWRYANSWRDAWLLTGTALIVLNLTGAFTVSGYRRAEGIVTAAQSSLLMIQLPVALASKGVRDVESVDPCLALVDARNILVANADDAREHTNTFAHVVAISIPILTTAIVAAATGHFDFVGNGNEGVTTLVGVALGELQVLTYPRPSVKMSGTSLTVTF
jgi:hypothetical protein